MGVFLYSAVSKVFLTLLGFEGRVISQGGRLYQECLELQAVMASVNSFHVCTLQSLFVEGSQKHSRLIHRKATVISHEVDESFLPYRTFYISIFLECHYH